MTNIPQNNEFSQENIQQEEIEFKRPQYVIIDDRNSNGEETEFDSKNSDEQDSHTAKSPISLRFLCFLGLIFCLIFGLGMLFLSIVSTLISTISLFRNSQLNQSMLSFWKLTTHTLIAGLGFILGIISPTLGLGLIVLYFSVTGEIIDNNILHKIIKRSFNKF